MTAAPRFAMFSVRVHLGAVAVAEQRLREDGFHNAWCEAGSVMTMVMMTGWIDNL